MTSRVRKLAGDYLARSIKAIQAIDLDAITECAEVIIRARSNGGRVFIIGNGGSASTASHMAIDLSKGSAVDHGIPVNASALVDNMAVITAIANDIDFDSVFAEQLSVSATNGDVLVAISASGNSTNVLSAVYTARERGVTTIALTGFGGGELSRLADLSVVIESSEYGPVEDAHLVLNHMLTDILRIVGDESAN